MREMERVAVHYSNGWGMLAEDFAKKQMMHELSARYYSWQHFWKIFFPIQLLVSLAAGLAFISAAVEHSHRHWAYILSIAGGLLGFIAAFINAMDRYLDWRTLGEMHKKCAHVHQKVAWELKVSAFTRGGQTVEEMANPLLSFDECIKKLKNLEENHVDVMVPYQIRMAFDKLQRLVVQQFYCVDETIRDINQKGEKQLEGWQLHTKFEILIAAYSILMTQITQHSNSWPYLLPDSGSSAEKARIETEKLLKLRLHAIDDSDELFRRVCFSFDAREDSSKGVAPPPARGDEAA